MNSWYFLAGVTVTTFSASGLFFYKFWRASHDRFFLGFALACWLIASERVVSLFIDGTQEAIRTAATESSSWVYFFRLLAFVIILGVIIDRNRRTGRF
jgi:hypothetical protein